MSNNLVPNGFGPPSKLLAGVPRDNAMGAGISTGYAVVGYRGKVWSVRSGGVETKLMRPDGDGPVNSIEVVIVLAPAEKAKTYYKTWVEGSSEPPVCSSMNGLTPDPGVAEPQSKSCLTCPKNQFGSKVTEDKKQLKACADSKRLAVVPTADLQNERFGGPMLLRVPGGSLTALAAYDAAAKEYQHEYFSIATRISFDPEKAFPKLVFNAVRPLTDDELATVLELRKQDRTRRICSGDGLNAAQEEAAPEAVKPASFFEQPPAEEPKAEAKPEPKKAKAKPQPIVVEPEPETQSVEEVEDLEAELDALLGPR